MANNDQQRLRIVDPDAADPAWLEIPSREKGRVLGIGAILRAERRRRGLKLDAVAERLRIRRAYLEAIEDEAFAKLPGPTYAVGFVRAYSDLLDLDTEEVVRLFRDHAGYAQRSADLVFREPITEARFPTGAVLLIAVMLAAVAYGGWYYLSMTNQSPIALVDHLPDRLVALLPGQGSPAPATGGANGGAAAPGQSAAPGLDTPAAVVIPPADAPTLPPAARTDPATDPATDPGAGLATDPDRAAEAFSADTMIGASPPGPGTDQSGVAESGAAGGETAEAAGGPPGVADQVPPLPDPAPPVASLAPPAGQPAVPPPPPPFAGAGDTSRVYGQPQGSTRVSIRATGDSWLQVLERDGTVLLSRTLRPGDTYHVPDRAGLSLWTGNAGALEVFVDGERAPPLGDFGAVRRNVDLAPDALRPPP